MSAHDERFDGMFLSMCQAQADMPAILNTFFCFLRRKTDFYHVLQGDERVGFPPGVAEKMVMQAFNRYKDQVAAAPSRALLEQELERKNAATTSAVATRHRAAPPPAPRLPAGTSAAATIDIAGMAAMGSTRAAEGDGGAYDSAHAPTPEPATAAAMVRQGGGVRQEALVTYNGAQDDGYSWAQTAKDVTVQIFLPKGTRARDVDILFKPSHLLVGMKGQPPIIDGDLPERVLVDDCTWNLEVENGELTITLEKSSGRWWKSVVEGGKEIDTTKVDSVKSIDEYDGETQGAIRKIMWDQDQKAKGLKTSEELQQEKLLRQAWDAPGSPFAGQPFDPGAVNWGGGGHSGGRMPPTHGPR